MGSDFTPTPNNFDNARSGITGNFPVIDENCKTEYFLAYFDDEAMNFIVTETNVFHRQNFDAAQLSQHSQMKRWTCVTVDELYVFFALLFLMAHIKNMSLLSTRK